MLLKISLGTTRRIKAYTSSTSWSQTCRCFGSDVLGGSTVSRGDAAAVNTAYLGVMGDAIAHENAGYSIASADFDGDGRDEVAIGIPGASVDGVFWMNR